MTAIMQSIRPEWCELIASGKKTMEIRKTRPKIEPPFKVYIYCTKGCESIWTKNYERDGHLNGKVIGEYVCDKITQLDIPYPCFQKEINKDLLISACLTYSDVHNYAGSGNRVYGWHISDLVIYDTPKELTEFRRWKYGPMWAEKEKIKRPPQSWAYVEERT